MKKITVLIPLLLLFVAGCNNSDTTGDPKTVLSNFLTALSKKDIQQAKKYVTEDSEGMINMMQMSMHNMESPQANDQFNPDKVTIGTANIDGDEAHVPVTEKESGETVNFILKKEKGSWKVAFDMATLGRMATEKMKEKGIDTGNLDSIMNKIPKDQLEKAKKLMDSFSKDLKDVPPAQLKEAQRILDSISKQH